MTTTPFWSKHGTDILTGVGIIGMGASAIYTGFKAGDMKAAIEARKAELGVKKLPFKEYFKIRAFWVNALVSTTMFAGGAGCVVAAHCGDKRAAGAIAAAYTASEVALAECRRAIVDTVGEKKAEEIASAVVHQHDQEFPVNQPAKIIATGKGDHLMVLEFNKKAFRSTVNEVNDVKNRLNSKLNLGEQVSVSDLCWELGIDSCEADDAYIWDPQRTGLIEFRAPDGGVNAEGEPYIIWSFANKPTYAYTEFFSRGD